MQPQPQYVSAILDGEWVDAQQQPSKYFSKEVKFRPTPLDMVSTPARPREQMLLLKNYDRDELSEILSQLPIQLPDEIIEQITQQTRSMEPSKINTNKINALRLRSEFSLAINHSAISEFNVTLNRYFQMIQRNELDLDFPFHISGCSPFFVAFVEERCIEMAKRTYNTYNERFEKRLDDVTERQLNDLRNVMLFSFARPRRDNNASRVQGHLKDVDNIYCSIERVATLCFAVIDTSMTPWDESTTASAFSLLNDCCDHLIKMNTDGVRPPDLKQKMADRAHRILDRLNTFSHSSNCSYEICQSRMRDMKQKLHDGIKHVGPGGGAKSKNKSNKKINSNKNKNSRRKINKNSRRKINKNKKKTLRLRIKK
jgi:hypothetical protein